MSTSTRSDGRGGGGGGACVCVCAAQGLGKKQAELLDPLVDFVSELLGTRVKTSDALLGAEQTPDATSQLERHLRSLSHYELAALDSLSGVGKSTVRAFLPPSPSPHPPSARAFTFTPSVGRPRLILRRADAIRDTRVCVGSYAPWASEAHMRNRGAYDSGFEGFQGTQPRWTRDTRVDCERTVAWSSVVG